MLVIKQADEGRRVVIHSITACLDALALNWFHIQVILYCRDTQQQAAEARSVFGLLCFPLGSETIWCFVDWHMVISSVPIHTHKHTHFFSQTHTSHILTDLFALIFGMHRLWKPHPLYQPKTWLIADYYVCHTCIFSTSQQLRSPQQPGAAFSCLGWVCRSYGLLSHEVSVTSVVLALIPHVGVVAWEGGHRWLKRKPQSRHWYFTGKTALMLSDCWVVPSFTM